MLQWMAPGWNEVVRDIECLQNPKEWRTVAALTKGDNEKLLHAIVQIRDYCRKGELSFTASYCEEVLFRATLYSYAVRQERFVNPYPPKKFAEEMAILAARFDEEVKAETFLTIEHKRIPYFRKTELFGELVAEKFPSSSIDIEEAGNCFALNRYTACVFHLMRGLERPLRSMARSVGVADNIENWGSMINQINAKIKAFENLPRSPEKTEMSAFYSEAALQFQYFKNAWRNFVVHENCLFDEEKTLQIFEHVRAFMQSLAIRLSE